MAKRLGQTRFGVAVQQDDGTVVTLPESLAPAPDPIDASPVGKDGMPLPTPDASPVPAIAAQDLPSPAESPVPMSASPDLMGAPPALAPMAPVSLAPTTTDAIAPVDTSEVAPPPIAPPVDPMATMPPEAPQDAPAAPIVDPAAYTPEDQALDAVRVQAAQAANLAREQADAMHWQQRDLADLEAKRQEADARTAEHRAGLEAAAQRAADDFASFDVTPEERSSVIPAIAMIFGGIGNILMGNLGGANPVIGILERKAEQAARDRAAQQAKLGQVAGMRRAAVDNASAWAKDQNAQFAATKAGILESYARQIEAKAADFAAPSEIAKGEQAAAKLREAAAKARADAAEAEHKRQLDEAKFQLDQRKVAIDQYSADTARKNVGLGYARIGEDKRQFNVGRTDALAEKDRQYKLDLAKLDLEIEKASKEGDAKSVTVKREERESLEADQARRVGVFPVTLKDDQGRPTGIAWQDLKQADGKEFRAPDPKRAQDLAAKGSAVTQSVALLDKLNRAREKYGWESDLYKSDEWREMQADYGQLILVAKDAAGLGALAGPDIDILNKAFGTKDPSELRDPGAGLTASRRNLINGYNANLRAAGYTGDAFDIPDVASKEGLKKAAELSGDNQIVEDVTKMARKRGLTDSTQVPKGIGMLPSKYAMSPAEQRKLDPLFTRAATGDSSAQAAVQQLARDRVIGPAVRARVIGDEIDLGTYWTPEDRAAWQKDFEKADLNAFGRPLGNAPKQPTGAAR